MSPPKILFVEDDVRLRKSFVQEFKDKGYETFEADSVATIPEGIFDFAVLDLRLESESGLKSIEFIKKKSPDCRIVMLTGYGSVASTVEAMKLGAWNYLIKPVDSDVLEAALLNSDFKSEASGSGVQSLSQHEHEYIEFILTQNKGNITKTAKDLGLHRQSLQRKLKKKP